MSRCLTATLFFIIWTVVLAGSVSAQEGQQEDGSLLPDIDPQDIEIRTQYQARFPGLRRQPILGFNPRARVHQVDPNRMPFIESYEETMAQLPVGEISRPEAPDYNTPLYPPPHNFFGRVGFGSYLSPEAEFILNREISDGHWISGGLNWNSTDGHLDQASSFRDLDLTTRYRGKVGTATVLGIEAGVRESFNHMFELHPFLQGEGEAARNSHTGFQGGMRLQQVSNTIEQWNIGLNGAYNRFELDGRESPERSSELSDWRAAVDLNRTWAGERLHETIGGGVDLRAGGYQLAGDSYNWHLAGLKGSYEQLIRYQTKINATLGLYHVSDAVTSSRFYVAPEVRAEHYLADQLTVYGSLTGLPDYTDRDAYYRENVFLNPDQLLEHSFHWKGSTGLVLEFFRGNQIRGDVSYQHSINYPWYARRLTEEGVPDIGGMDPYEYYDIQFSDANIFRVSAGLGIDLLPDVLWLDAEGYWQNPELTSGERIPYEEEIGLRGGISVRPVRQLQFEVWGDFVGPRVSSSGSDLDAFIHAGTRVELRIRDQIGVYSKIENLLNQEYEVWRGYTERPLQIYAGVTFNF
ncbi:MAG: hypothetical protein WD355_00260 [Balneolaceae bacterium]